MESKPALALFCRRNMLDPFNQVPESSANWEITIPESFTASGRPFTMRENRVRGITVGYGYL
ncbi:hypothetical protein DPMN_157568 [Dreissena polymorpha]|uniref:Uncharacterized protein n=1 Tax=Dreissena polymorpha TaxID=45954 RepID=A0A9D4EKR3_DREPO|nr:hypothetical protein DPMN_157568 [Dreissena polymorpha]